MATRHWLHQPNSERPYSGTSLLYERAAPEAMWPGPRNRMQVVALSTSTTPPVVGHFAVRVASASAHSNACRGRVWSDGLLFALCSVGWHGMGRPTSVACPGASIEACGVLGRLAASALYAFLLSGSRRPSMTQHRRTLSTSARSGGLGATLAGHFVVPHTK